MLDFLKSYHIQFLICCGVINLLLALFVTVISFRSYKKKISLLRIMLSISIYLFSDAFSYIFDGKNSAAGYWGLRISTFLLFTTLLANVYFLCEYVTTIFMESGKFRKLPKRLLLGFTIPIIGITLAIISQFTNMYYYIDKLNVYHRGSAYWISFILPFVDLCLLLSFVLQYRTLVNKKVTWSIIIFTTLPMIASVVQIYVYGFSFISFSCGLAAILLFLLALINQNNELTKAATTELSTGLPNTYGFLTDVDKIINSKDITKYSGFYFDIVRMRSINSKYGRNNGDEIIIKYAHTLRKLLDEDEILARLGGNFFVALIKKSNTEKFLDILKDTTVKIKIDGEMQDVHISSVAGIYEITKKNIVAGQIIGATANAIGYAKNIAHKPYVVLDDNLENEINKNIIMEENCKIALHKGEFEAFYQPKVDSRTNKLCGAEALVRWRKDGKLIPPFEFIPIMERNGSICNLDFYVLNKVCCDIKEWISKGISPVKISVNFSRKNLANPILAEAISKAIEKHNIPKEFLQIEITETIDEFPLSYLIGVVEALHRYNISVAIDDFGVGSSSINLLKAVKFDILKIDKSFIDYSNEKEKRLLENIIHMAQDIGIDVLAEGVENKSQVLELSNMNCFIIQGYVYDKPIEKKDFENRLISTTYKFS